MGAASLFDRNVTRIGHEETRRLLLRDDDPARPPNDETFGDRRTLEIGGERIDLAWHGPNHSPDNIVIHLPDHDTLMLIDIVNPGWAPIYQSNLTEDIPGYIEAPANALAYAWKHFIGGHNGRLGTRDDVTLHQQGDRVRRSHSLLRALWRERLGGRERDPRRDRPQDGRARTREIHRCAGRSRRLHRERRVPGNAVDPPRPRLRVLDTPLMARLPVRPLGDQLVASPSSSTATGPASRRSLT